MSEMREVTQREFEEFEAGCAGIPGLLRGTFMAAEPPVFYLHDPARGEWPKGVIATISLSERYPHCAECNDVSEGGRCGKCHGYHWSPNRHRVLAALLPPEGT